MTDKPTTKTRKINIRVVDNELKNWQRAASLEGLTMSAWIRWTLNSRAADYETRQQSS